MKRTAEQIAERTQQWEEDIKYRLEYLEEHTRRELKVFEAYFIKGKEPYIETFREEASGDPIPLIYRLWFAEEERWPEITRRLLGGPEGWHTKIPPEGFSRPDENVIRPSLEFTSDFLLGIYKGRCNHFNGVTPYDGYTEIPPLGLIGGLEKKLYNFLTGKAPGSEDIRYKGKPLINGKGVFLDPRSICLWLDGRQPHNPYHVDIYRGEDWVSGLEYISDLEWMEISQDNSSWLPFTIMYLKYIAQYARHGSPGERTTYCQEVCRLLDAANLIEPVKALWEEARVYNGKVDLNEVESYRNLGPYYLQIN